MSIGGFRMPQIPSIETDSDCEHIPICEKLDIITKDCFRGVHPMRRCNQGQYAQIKILSMILNRLPSQQE